MKPITKRLLIVILIIVLILFYARISVRLQIGFPCLFHHFTGWYCPGCGLGRSVRCMLAGEWYQAFRYNVLLMPCIIPGTLLLLYTAYQYIKGVPYHNYLFIRIVERFGFIIAGILLVYGILRNILVILAP